MSEALSLMWRDIEAAPALVVLMLLPVLFSVPVIRRGSRLAWAPIVILAAQIFLWFSYYATDWLGNPGLGGAVLVGLIPTQASALLLFVAWLRCRRPGVVSEAGGATS